MGKYTQTSDPMTDTRCNNRDGDDKMMRRRGRVGMREEEINK